MRHLNIRLLASIIILILGTKILSAQNKPTITIGILTDGNKQGTGAVAPKLKDELNSILGSKYDIQIPQDKILDAVWSAANASANYDRLVQDPDVDIILGFGILSGSAIGKQDAFTKPVISLGIFEPELHGLPSATENKSGVHNLTYLLLNRSITRDLDTFYEVYPYKKVGILFYSEILELIDVDLFQKTMGKNKISYQLLPITTSIKEAFSIASADIDALYLSYLGPFEGEKKNKIIDGINSRNIPSFGSSVADIQNGALAAVAPKEDFHKIIRRIVLNVEAILNGEDPANLPVHLSFEENLMLNMRTAKKIGFSPKFSLLAKAELVNEFPEEGVPVINLLDVMHKAMTASLDLKIEEGAVKSAKEDVSLAHTNFFPSLTLGATGVQINKKGAESSFGQQAERTLSGIASVEQLIFSEQAIGNVTIQKHQLRGVEYGYEQVKLDVILNAAVAYFNVLKAKTGRKIQKDNVDLTNHNLEIAKQREAVGYSGRSDVYRWESSLTVAITDLLAAQNNVALAKVQLNQLLNRPMDQVFITQEISLSDSLYISYLESVRSYINSPYSLGVYTEFLIEEALNNAPEIRQLDASINALERSLTSLRLQRFVPTIGLGAEAQHIFSRYGAGSDVPGVDPLDDTWTVGVNLSLPLFQGGATSVNIQQSSIEINKLKDQRRQLAQAVELKVRSAILELVVHAANLTSSQKSAEFSVKSLELVQDQYAKGQVSIVGLVDAQNTALNTNLNALVSEYDLLTGQLTTERSIGKYTILSTQEEQQDFYNRFEAYFKEHAK